MKSHYYFVILLLLGTVCFSCKKEAVSIPPNPMQTERSDTTSTGSSGTTDVGFTVEDSDTMKVQHVGIGR